MNKILDYSRLVETNAQSLSGIFTYADLASLTNTSEKTLLPRRIKQIEKAGILSKFIRGVYVYEPAFDPQVLSQRLSFPSYISLEPVLAKNLIIGTIPKFRLTAVKLGRSRLYETDYLTIEHLGIQKSLFFGFKNIDGINIADPEKALLDCLYFYQKGRRLLFNVYEDINFKRLDARKIENYLGQFKNPKFVAFVTSLMKAS